MTIADYLRELELRLPRIRRRRALAEVEDHLLDAAARHRRAGLSGPDAEEAATRDFGEVDLVAGRFASEAAVVETRVASALVLATVAFFVFPLYVVPENTLPPAAWAEKPRDILVLQIVVIGLWIGAASLAAAGALLAWTRWSRFTSHGLEVAAIVLSAAAVMSAALIARWFSVTEDTPLWPVLAAPLAAACLGACGVTACWAHRRRALLTSRA